MDYKFVINKTNKYGESQYIESPYGKSINDIPVWVVKNPSIECTNWLLRNYPGSGIRYYNNIKFVMSHKALEVINPENSQQSSGIIVRFTYRNEGYYIMVTDIKDYAQFCHGASESGETPEEAAVRELQEELAIFIDKNYLLNVGNFSYTNYDPLVEYKRHSVTTMFLLDLPFESVKHLFPDGINQDGITITDVKSLQFSLNEINYVLCIKESRIDTLPKFIDEIQIPRVVNGKIKFYPCKFSDHNIEFLRRLIGLPPKYDVSFFRTFNVFA